MRPLDYLPSVPDAPRLDGENHALVVAAGSPKPNEKPKNAAPAYLSRLEEQLHASLDVHLALQPKLPPIWNLPQVPTLQDRVAAARRKLAELRTAAHIADTVAARSAVLDLSALL